MTATRRGLPRPPAPSGEARTDTDHTPRRRTPCRTEPLPPSTEARNGSHPGPVAVEEHDLLWDGLPPATTQKLGEPLDEGLVSHRKGRGGRTFAYIEGRIAIDQANRIFGYGGWGYELAGPVELRESESVDRRRARRGACVPTPPPYA